MKKNKIAAALLLFALSPLWAQDPSEKQISQWLKELEAWDIGLREEAQLKLTENFKHCEKKLKELDGLTTDAETKHRVGVILKEGPRGIRISRLDDKLSGPLKASKKDIADLAYSPNPADWKPVFQAIEFAMEPVPGARPGRGKGGARMRVIYPATWEDRMHLTEAVLTNAISRFGDLSKIPKEPFDTTLAKLLRAAELSADPRYAPHLRKFLKHENEHLRGVTARYFIAALPREKETELLVLEHLKEFTGASHFALAAAREWRMADRYWKQMEAIALDPNTPEYYSREIKAQLSTAVREDE